MPGGVLARRGVATPNVSTARAAPQMKPPAVAGEAFNTPVPARRHCRLDAVILHRGHVVRDCTVGEILSIDFFAQENLHERFHDGRGGLLAVAAARAHRDDRTRWSAACGPRVLPLQPG